MREMFRTLVFLLLLLIGVSAVNAVQDKTPGSSVVALRVEGAIGPATSDFISRSLAAAIERDATLVVLEMDTPGGLDTSMRAIIKDILASPIPIATYVSPEGARAASAGTFILYASHIAAMAPATNLGAASPVSIGMPGGGGPSGPSEGDQEAEADNEKEADNGDAAPDSAKPAKGKNPLSGSDTMTAKVTNDAAAYIRSLAELRGRDVDFAERAVLKAHSLSASQALEQGVIEFVAVNLDDLLSQLDGREIRLDSGATVTLATANVQVEHIAPDWRSNFLSIISNPQIAMVLMMIGIYGLFFEFTNPGFGVPGVAGLICLLIALYSFQLLPVNWAGVALIAIGAVLMLAEAFVPSFGALGIGGMVAVVMGGLFLMDGDIPGFAITLPFLLSLAFASAVLLFALGAFVLRSRQRLVVSGREEMIGALGTITNIDNSNVYAHIHGESWQVESSQPLTPGDRVKVEAVNGLTLKVEPFAGSDDSTARSKQP